MAKKISREEKADRQRRRNSIIVGVVLVGLMIFGTLGAYVGSNDQNNVIDNSFEYEGYKFKFVQEETFSYYAVKVGENAEVAFYSTPYQVKALSLDESFLNSYSFSSLIFTSEPLPLKGNIPLYQQYLDSITNEITLSTGKTVLRGYLEKDIFNEGAVYTCDDASTQNLVVVYKGIPAKVVSPGIYSTDTENCYDLFATDADLILLRDYLVLLHWGILND